MTIIGIPAQIKTDNSPAYALKKMKQFFCLLSGKAYFRYTKQSYRSGIYRKIKSNYKRYVKQTKKMEYKSRNRLNGVLLTFNFPNAKERGTMTAEKKLNN